MILPNLLLFVVLSAQPANARLVTVIYKPDLLKEAESAVGHWFLAIASDKEYESLPEERRAKIRTNYYKKKIWIFESHPDEKSLKMGAAALWEFERMARWDMGLLEGLYPGQDK